MVAVFHPCAFGFLEANLERVGNITSGGVSLSGIDDKMNTDGGGFWRYDLSEGKTISRESGLAWRALKEGMDGGATAVIVRLCGERRFQPVGARVRVPHSDATPFSDDSLYVSSGASYVTVGATALRATSMQISGESEKSLLGGELFSILHPSWGWRVYRIVTIEGDQITFRPPLREATTAGTAVEFDEIRCQMQLAASSGNPTTVGKYTSCAMTFVEDMRKP